MARINSKKVLGGQNRKIDYLKVKITVNGVTGYHHSTMKSRSLCPCEECVEYYKVFNQKI